jgi:hypothetical protein
MYSTMHTKMHLIRYVGSMCPHDGFLASLHRAHDAMLLRIVSAQHMPGASVSSLPQLNHQQEHTGLRSLARCGCKGHVALRA